MRVGGGIREEMREKRKKKEKRKRKKCGTWVVGKKKKKGNGTRGRERGKNLRKEGILGVMKKINILKNGIVKLK